MGVSNAGLYAQRCATAAAYNRGGPGDLDLTLREQIGLPITIADQSLDCVAIGTGRSLEYEKQLRHVIDYES